MKIDAHPKTMAGIMVALGIFGIGVILTVGFFEKDALLGVGVTMAVIGGAGTILGCIHLGAQKDDAFGESSEEAERRRAAGRTLAPYRIPPRPEDDDDDDDGPLSYPECTASPSPARNIHGEPVDPRTGYVVDDRTPLKPAVVAQPPAFLSTEKVVHTGNPIERSLSRQAFPLSPYEQRSFPVPPALAASVSTPSNRPLPAPLTAFRKDGRSSSSYAIPMPSGYDSNRVANTQQEIDEQIKRHRDYGADDYHRQTFMKKNYGDDDKLPEGYWSPN